MKIPFDSNDLVLAIVAAAPDHRVKGKKRLQKFAFLLKSVGVKCSAQFKIWDFGPYSSEVAKAAEWLSISGKITEQEELVTPLKRFMTVYSVDNDYKAPKLEARFETILKKLDSYSNVELEVAATVQFFLQQGRTKEEATVSVRELKPTKALPQIIEKSFSLIREIETTH